MEDMQNNETERQRGLNKALLDMVAEDKIDILILKARLGVGAEVNTRDSDGVIQHYI